MFRSSAIVLSAALLAVSAGCRAPCGSGTGCFTSNSRDPSGHLMSNGKIMEGCFDPVTGRPIPCQPDTGTILIPGGTAQPGMAPRPDELPYPSPGEMIPRPNVPYAPPFPAPGTGNEGAALTPKNGTTVKNGATKN